MVTYTPDSAGRVLSAVDGGNSINYVTGATYGPDSSLTGFISGSGGTAPVTNLFSYNNRLQPCRMTASTGTLPSNCLDATNHGNVFDIGYDFHKGNGTAGSGTDNGNVYGITNYKDSNRTQTFTYDPLNRLLTAQNAGTNCAATTVNGKTEYWGNSYTYDAWGNLLGKTITKCGAENLSVTADAHNWLHISPNDYQYDAAGNMTYDATSNLNYSFDQENRITGAAGYTYTYDGDGNRVRKSNGNLAANGTLYWYMSPGVVAETDLAGTSKSEYIFFDGDRVARRDGVNGAGGVFYYFSDHLKTASIITDSAGTIKADSDYYPWGGELQFVANDSNDYKFTGKKRDAETGLDYFGARYYSNGLGRWVSADWSATPVPVPYADLHDPQTLNLYQFVGGNPASKSDLDGHWPTAGDFGKWLDGKIQKFESSSFGRLYTRSVEQIDRSGNIFPDPLKSAHFVANTSQIGNATGNALGGNHTTLEKVDAIAKDAKNTGLFILTVTGGAGIVKGVIGKLATEGSSFEILDGVRRAKAADLVGKSTISGQVVDAEGAVGATQQLPVGKLLFPQGNY